MTNSSSAIIELPNLNHPDAWEAPVLFDDVTASDIPALALPGCFGEFATALSLATETPQALAMMTVLGVLSVIAAKRFQVCPKDGWLESVNLYVMIGLPPANNKSQVLKACTAPLIEWEREQANLLEPQIKQQRSERKTQEKIIEGLRSKAAKTDDHMEQQQLIRTITEKEELLNEPLTLPVLFTTDATPESLAISAYEQGGNFAIFSDEGGIMETLAGLYTHGIANIDILLKGIDGGEVRVKRKDRSFIVNPLLSIVLTVQPSIIQNMGTKRAYSGNGCLERFLYVLPQSKLGFRTHDTPPLPTHVQRAYISKIKELLAIASLIENEKEVPYILTLSTEAFSIWRAFQATIEKELKPSGKLNGCLGWGGKISGFVLRIAGLLHMAEYKNNQLIINKNTMQNAVDIAEILVDHAIKAYGLMGNDQSIEDAKEVFNWVKNTGKNSFTKTDITSAMRNRKISKKERLTKALSLLAERNIISEPIKLPTRKPTTVFYVNPEILVGGN